MADMTPTPAAATASATPPPPPAAAAFPPADAPLKEEGRGASSPYPLAAAFPPADAPPKEEGRGGSSPYPLASATYEEVVADAALFMRTLENLHRFMGTKFMVPTIGGKSLDLHRLFVEVTCRGGLEKVIAERKWREIIAVFHFPSTITSASFVLRKYYISLLHAYEQVYFFQNKDAKVSLTDHSSAAQSTPTSLGNTCIQKNPPLQPGCLVTGKINGKFEHGYIISANVGSEILRGVLYHVPFQSSDPHRPTIQYCDKKRSRKAMKDPSRPKSHRSGYNFFFAEQCTKLKPLYSREERAIRIGDMWNKLDSAEKETAGILLRIKVTRAELGIQRNVLSTEGIERCGAVQD